MIDKDNLELKKKIIEAADNVRKKYKFIKAGQIEEDSNIKNILKPISDPLEEINKIISTTNTLPSKPSKITRKSFFKKKQKKKKARKSIVGKISSHQHPSNSSSTQIDNESETDQTLVYESAQSDSDIQSAEEEEEEEEQEEEKITKRKPFRYSENLEKSFQKYSDLPKKYILEIFHNKDVYDDVFGPRFNVENETWEIGNVALRITKDGDFFVGKNKYTGTPGLYELMFKKRPENYSRLELNNYRKIVLQTNLPYRDFNNTNQLRGSRSWKYKNIMKPIVATREGKIVGSGNNNNNIYNTNKIDYVYWDDPNELVSRLALLHASTNAGNNSHLNEINAIEEELREAKIIF